MKKITFTFDKDDVKTLRDSLKGTFEHLLHDAIDNIKDGFYDNVEEKIDAAREVASICKKIELAETEF